ncbi:MAG: hypothetical protein DRN96_01645 [Thermoproteota archaeon]|nr:MAG: hypothetical protein DRN96_01645 [Candidatus Korarchaeota archaeon]
MPPILELIRKYFIEPILKGSGYNPVNTAAYAALFLLALLMVVKIFEKLRLLEGFIGTRKFTLTMVLYGVMAGLLRVARDAGVTSTLLLVTPMIFGVMTAVFLSMAVASKLLGSPLPFQLAPLPSIAVLAVLGAPQNLRALAYILALNLPLIAAYIPAKQKSVVALVHSQYFDATATVVAISQGYWEQHVIPRLILSIHPYPLAAVLFMSLKSLVALLLARALTTPELGWKGELVKGILTSLGFGTGVRDALRATYLV